VSSLRYSGPRYTGSSESYRIKQFVSSNSAFESAYILKPIQKKSSYGRALLWIKRLFYSFGFVLKIMSFYDDSTSPKICHGKSSYVFLAESNK
jgi:hypothetical protein